MLWVPEWAPLATLEKVARGEEPEPMVQDVSVVDSKSPLTMGEV